MEVEHEHPLAPVEDIHSMTGQRMRQMLADRIQLENGIASRCGTNA